MKNYIVITSAADFSVAGTEVEVIPYEVMSAVQRRDKNAKLIPMLDDVQDYLPINIDDHKKQRFTDACNLVFAVELRALALDKMNSVLKPLFPIGVKAEQDNVTVYSVDPLGNYHVTRFFSVGTGVAHSFDLLSGDKDNLLMRLYSSFKR